MNLEVVLAPSGEGGYTVHVPALPGCVSEGESREEALRNIREAIELYLEPVEEVPTEGGWSCASGAATSACRSTPPARR